MVEEKFERETGAQEIEPEAEAAQRPRGLDRRGQWCIKHAKVTPELIDLVREASRKTGYGISEWAADILRREAERALERDPLPDTRESLMQIAQRLDKLEKAMTAPALDSGAGPQQESEPSGVFSRLFRK